MIYAEAGERQREVMRKILIATPLKGGLSPDYFKLLFEVLATRQNECKFLYTFVRNCGVQWARDECVGTARGLGFKDKDKVLFLDKDLKPSAAQVLRLAMHEEEAVVGTYSTRALHTHWHVVGMKGEDERPDGLMRIQKGAIGFGAFTMTAFDKVKAKFPERQYMKQDAGEVEKITLHEYFPMGILGPNTAEGKLARIREIVKSFRPPSASGDAFETVNSIFSILDDADYSENQIAGEDYYFCKLLYDAGVPLYLDTQLLIPHTGETDFPIQTKDLLNMLNEPWRQDEVRALQQQQPQEEIVPS